MSRPTLADALAFSLSGVFRLLLLAYPRAFRRAFEAEMSEYFECTLRRRLERRGALAAIWWTATSCWDLLLTAYDECSGRSAVTPKTTPRPVTRRRQGDRMLSVMTGELRTAFRRLLGTPMFTLGALSIVAFGIGVNTAAFTLVNSFLFKPPAWNEPERVVSIYQDSDDGEPNSTSFPAYRDMTAFDDVFEAVAASTPATLRWKRDGAEREVATEFVSASFLDVVGLRPLLGPGFTPEHDRVGAGAFAIVNHRFWQAEFAGDPDIVGRSIELAGQPVTIVGVGPRQFGGNLMPMVTDLWLSISSVGLGGEYRIENLERRQDHWYDVKARLAPGVTPADAQAAMTTLATRLEREYPDINTNRDITVFAYGDVRLHPDADKNLNQASAGTMALVGLVLLLACTNLANLLTVRGMTRLPEAAVRRALGASNAAVARSFIAESLLLSVLGGLLGLALARALMRLTPALPLPLPAAGALDTAMDLRVVAFTFGLVIVTGVLFGIAPALRALSVDFAGVFHGGSRGASLQRIPAVLRGGLVSIQMAASIVLLIACALVVRNTTAALSLGAGVDANRVAWALADLEPLGLEPEQYAARWQEILERIESAPGVDAAALATRLPANGRGGSTTTVIEGYEPTTGTGAVELPVAWVGPRYFEVMGQALVEGRVFGPEDRDGSTPVVILGETAARRYWPGESAIGKRVRPQSDPDAWHQVVGVVADAKVRSLAEPPTPIMFQAADQVEMRRALIVARTQGDPTQLASSYPDEIRADDAQIEVASTGDLESYIRDGLASERTIATVLAVFAALALLLASLGIYSMVSYSVARRAPEIGIRMALGAAKRSVIVSVLGEFGIALGSGMTLGLLISVVMAQQLRDVLPAAGGVDPLAFSAGVLSLLLVAFVASYVPARRAAAADPASTLRDD